MLADHRGDVERVVGFVDPRTSFETDTGLEVTGSLDLSTELGQRVYDLVKAGMLSWSIGFTVPSGGRRKRDGVTEITEIDLAEISAVPVPANGGARTLAIKGLRPIQIATFEA